MSLEIESYLYKEHILFTKYPCCVGVHDEVSVTDFSFGNRFRRYEGECSGLFEMSSCQMGKGFFGDRALKDSDEHTRAEIGRRS